MRARHGIQPGKSWGTTTPALRQRWADLDCEVVLQWEALVNCSSIWDEHRRRMPARLQLQWSKVGCDRAPTLRKDELTMSCTQMIQQHGVRPGRTFGSLPAALQHRYALLDCDGQWTGFSTRLRLTLAPYAARLSSHCAHLHCVPLGHVRVDEVVHCVSMKM